ncbi:helix-turn-helix domain-containing protein [Yinghuangia sp. KLBMP8922]|uniref:Helix-turn-helix domain-containing protein n=2 Tax=Yinghuangia soli TaxID=2908204 RepID=A0AA41Q8D9_9ACTN|nr:helix-turn-helix domain-containing protein [Yinghuangia soli]
MTAPPPEREPGNAAAIGAALDWSNVEVAVPPPTPPLRIPGVSMAGFRQLRPKQGEITMVAHPSITLLLDLGDGDPLLCRDGAASRRGSVAIGLLPGDLSFRGCLDQGLQIRLTPIAAAAVLGGLSTELTGSVASFADVWGPDAGRLHATLRAAATWDERFALAASALRRRIAAARPPVDAEVAYTWQRTLRTGGRRRIETLADDTGWSRKRLSARFAAQLGVTPKRAARLVRFDRAAHLLAAGHTAADTAALSGYADQPHLHRDVKSFTGHTPAALAAAPWLSIDATTWPTAPADAR